MSNNSTVIIKLTSFSLPGYTMCICLNKKCCVFGVCSSASSAKRGIMKTCSYSVMPVTKAATLTATDPRLLLFLTVDGFVLPV